MRSGRNRLFLINTKYVKLAGAALAAVIVIVAAVLIILHSSERAQVKAGVDKVASSGVINVGLRGDLGQLCTYDAQTKTYLGLEKDIADELVNRLYPEGLLVNYVEVNSKTKDAFLQTGQLDISLAASVEGSVTGIVYSGPFFSDGCAFLVRQGEMTHEGGLSGGIIAVVQGTRPATKAKKEDKQTRLETYLESHEIDASVRSFASYPEAVEALRKEHVSAVCANETFLKLYGWSGMLILPERFMPVGFCVQVRKQLGKFYDAVQESLEDMKSDGTLARLLEKWELSDYAYLDEK